MKGVVLTNPDSSCGSLAPFLRWTGSKRALLPILRQSVPASYERYVEPFVGSGCLFFDLRPGTALLADNNRLLIETYEFVRENPIALHRFLSSSEATEDQYYKVRRRLSTTKTPSERAKCFVFLNRLCYNGVFRTNRLGHFNVPFGSRTGAMPSRAHLIGCSDATRRATLNVADFEETLNNCGAGDFVYADPPYFRERRSRHGEYGYSCFSEKDLSRFTDAVRRAHTRGARILISYRECAELRERLQGWRFTRVPTRRNVSALVASRKAVLDLLISNYSASKDAADR